MEHGVGYTIGNDH